MESQKQSCPDFPHFGAPYPDACCIDGYLWDLDSGDEPGMLSHGGDDPCPFCNGAEYVDWSWESWLETVPIGLPEAEEERLCREKAEAHRRKLVAAHQPDQQEK